MLPMLATVPAWLIARHQRRSNTTNTLPDNLSGRNRRDELDPAPSSLRDFQASRFAVQH